VKDDRLHFEYNYVGERYLLSSGPVPLGSSCLEFQFEKTGDRRGVGSILVRGKTVDQREFPAVVPWFHGWEGLDVGRDALAPVSENYDGEFPYSGDFEYVLFEVAPTEDEWLFEAVD
jgi:arylsulfatase